MAFIDTFEGFRFSRAFAFGSLAAPTSMATTGNARSHRKFTSNGNDLCVICGADSGIATATHVDERYGYVEGSGQLCVKCYNKV